MDAGVRARGRAVGHKRWPGARAGTGHPGPHRRAGSCTRCSGPRGERPGDRQRRQGRVAPGGRGHGQRRARGKQRQAAQRLAPGRQHRHAEASSCHAGRRGGVRSGRRRVFLQRLRAQGRPGGDRRGERQREHHGHPARCGHPHVPGGVEDRPRIGGQGQAPRLHLRERRRLVVAGRAGRGRHTLRVPHAAHRLGGHHHRHLRQGLLEHRGHCGRR